MQTKAAPMLIQCKLYFCPLCMSVVFFANVCVFLGVLHDNLGAFQFGFNAKPNGHYTQGACFYGQWANEIGIWWTSSPTDEGTGFLHYLNSNNDDFDGYGSCSPGICVSVRCIKD